MFKHVFNLFMSLKVIRSYTSKQTFQQKKRKKKEKIWFLKSHSSSEKCFTETRDALMSLDFMILFVWLAILQHPQL